MIVLHNTGTKTYTISNIDNYDFYNVITSWYGYTRASSLVTKYQLIYEGSGAMATQFEYDDSIKISTQVSYKDNIFTLTNNRDGIYGYLVGIKL